MNYDGDKIVDLLNRLYNNETKKEALKMLDTIELTEEDIQNLKI